MKTANAVLRLIIASVVAQAILLPGMAHAVDTNGTPIKWKDGKPAQTESTVYSVGFSPWQGSAVLSLYGGGAGRRFLGYERGGGGRDFSPNNKTTTTKKKKNKTQCQAYASDPVEVDSGAKLLTIPLFALPGEMGLKYTLYYNSDLASTAFPPESWRSSLEYRLDLYCGLSDPYVTCNHVTLFRPDGSSIQFSGNWSAYGSHPEIGGDGLATLTHNSNGTWTLHDEDATTQTYDSDGFLTSIKDASGIGWSINTSQTTIPPYTTKTTIVVTHTNGQSFSVVKSYNSSSRSMSVIVEDPANNIYSYVQYGTDLDIISLTLPGTPATTITFNYTGSNPLLSGVDYNNTPYWTTSYNGTRVSSDGAADSTERTSIVYAFQSGGMVATITNPLGLTTTNTYKTDAQGNYLLASVSNSAVQGCGATVNTMAWDGNDNVTRTVDNDGVTTTYDYAPNGQLQTKAEAAGTPVARTINYTWDPDAQLNRLLSMTIPGESRTSYTYNAQNRLASVAKTNLTDIGAPNQSLTTAYAYTLYSNGMVHTMIVTQPSPNGSDHITYAYDTHGNLTSATDGLGHVTTYSGYNGLNEVGKVVGPNGAETDYTYDARGRVASKTTHPNGTTAAWTYAYDGFGLLSQINAPDGEVTSWSRDAEKRIKTIAHNDKDGASTETFIYDANGDVTSDVIARGSDIGKSTSYAYNALGKVYQIKGSHGQVKTYAYDGNGNVLSVTDALGHKTRYTYDALNRVVGITNAASGVTSYAYDAGDHVIGVEDPRGLVTSYAWDGFGQLWRQISPDTGTTTFRYDAYGRLSYKQRADGMPEYFGYDALNRVLSRGTSEYGAQDFTWDNCTNGIGRLCTSKTDLISNQYTVGYNYTQEGQVSKRAFSFSNGTSYSVGYSYDNMGHLASVTYPDGNEAVYDYTDGVAWRMLFRNGVNTIYGVTGITYRPMDMAMSGWTSANGLINTIDYDSDLRPTYIRVHDIEGLHFGYDAANRITQIDNDDNSSMFTEMLSYDALNRLTGASSKADTESYQYDADGNRIYQAVNGVTTSFTYASTSNQLTFASGGINATYGYTAYGSAASIDGYAAYTYSPFGRLVNADGIDYAYSTLGQRLEKSGATGATYFAPDTGGALLAEERNGAWYDYVYLNGRLVSEMVGGGTFPVHADQTGRPITITDGGSETVLRWDAENLPFTRVVTLERLGDFNLGFPGQYYDSESGLWHNGYRDYDAATGRYIESDLAGLAGGINTYIYADDNPISNVDPLGLCPSHKCGNPPTLPAGANVKANIQQIQMDRAFAGPALIFNFYNLVRNGGPWDYKQQGRQYQAGGNFNYGATGAAAGFSTQILLRAAGYAQIEAGTSTSAWRGPLGSLGGPPYGDDPIDQSEIKAGIAYYNCLASGGQQ